MPKKKSEALPPVQAPETVIPVDYCDEMSASFVDYSVSVITDRALPDVRDGLKPVHRRILWAMHNLGLHSNTPYKKSARIVGEVMGKYHPHGDSSSYGAMVHMAQDWVYNYPLVDGHGNFGSIEGDQEAAQRYTEARLSAAAEDMLLANLNKDTVDFIPNYDGTESEPVVLPAAVPNILISGTEGIAVGMASKMPTHNLAEVVNACCALLDKPNLPDGELLRYIQGPDWPTGGTVVNRSELAEIYRSGAGKIRVRGKVHAEPGQYGKTELVVTEIPVTMIGAIDGFMETVANLMRTKVMPDVTDIKNFSGKEGIKIVIELRKGADAERNINILYKKAKLEDTFGYNAMLLSGGVPYQMSLKRILTEFLTFYRETLTRKYKALLAKELKNAEIKEGLLIAADCIDTIIEALRGSRDVATVKKCLTKGETAGIAFRTKSAAKQAASFRFTEAQADAILAMRLQSLIGLEIEALTRELEKSKKLIENYRALLGTKSRMTAQMKADMQAVGKKFGRRRRTELTDAEAVVLQAPEVKPEKVYALVNRFGYIKLIDEATRTRNAAGIETDYRFCEPVMTDGKLGVVTDAGQCHQIQISKVPLGKYNDKGVPLETVSPMSGEETAVALLSDMDKKAKLTLACTDGYVKRIILSELFTARKTTAILRLGEGSRLLLAGRGSGFLVLTAASGCRLAFSPEGIPVSKRAAAGVIGIKLDAGDTVTEAIFAEKVPEAVKGRRGVKGKK